MERLREEWDVVVMGAGPAGAMAAREAARQGATVLLVDKAAFPRRKVCGSCVNVAALGLLEAAGLGALPTQSGAVPLHRLYLAAGRRDASIALPGGVALSREQFDAALVERAVMAGAHFLPQTAATVGGVERGVRGVTLMHQGRQRAVSARVVLAAYGLHGDGLEAEGRLGVVVAPHSRVGVGTIVERSPRWYRAGTIFMACGRSGYVGVVRLEDGRLDVAAALDPAFVRDRGGPGRAVSHLLHQVGWPPLDGLERLSWQGTPPLTRRRARLAAEKLFLIGDAAGYVEPFTGEGIAWALASGMAVVPFALQAARRWEPSLATQWMARYHRLIGKRQRMCRIVTGALRQIRVTQVAVRLLARVPILASPIVRLLNAPMKAAPVS